MNKSRLQEPGRESREGAGKIFEEWMRQLAVLPKQTVKLNSDRTVAQSESQIQNFQTAGAPEKSPIPRGSRPGLLYAVPLRLFSEQ